MSEKRHACPAYPHFLHGADYNAEQWPREIWDEDMRLMKLANCNEMSVGIFSWAKLEPEEGVFDFSFMDEIVDKIYENGGRVILATPSGARPRWLAEKYPEVLRVGRDGVREKFRARHNHCLTSPVYREKVRIINEKLAERYGAHPAVVAWHISNELGGECHCQLCTNAFRDYLRKKFDGDIEKLNHAYWTTFWSHTYQSFEQIDPPGDYTEDATHGLNLDWQRFVTEQTASFVENEIVPIRKLTPHIPVTINMMWGACGLDNYRLAQVIDFASWDCYPEWHSGDDAVTAQQTAFWHDYYRALKGKPFLLMESTPSLVNWKPYNKPKRPGLDVLSSIQAVAHGSDSVQYFQFRKSRGSAEKLHGAIVDHNPTEHTRVFQSVRRTGEILKQIDEIAGTVTRAKVTVIYDWENLYALSQCQGYAKDDKKYYETCYAYHRIFWSKGIDCDVISSKADLSPYSLVVAPMQYMTDEATVEKLTRYVENGGTLYATYMLGTVDENDLCYLGGIPGSKLKDVFGIVAEEIDTLYPHERQHAQYRGGEYELVDYCETVNLHGAEALALYTDGYYAGTPAVTFHTYGKGKAVYQACRDSGALSEQVIWDILTELGICSLVADRALPRGVTAHSRTDGTHTYLFVENYSPEECADVHLREEMIDMLTGEKTDMCHLAPYSFSIFKSL